jgi:hypothetical protein
MSRGEEKSKRWRIWRPRFSLRTLVVILTFICIYFGSWQTTTRFGVPQPTSGTPVSSQGDTKIVFADSPAPLLIRQDEVIIPPINIQTLVLGGHGGGPPPHNLKRRYYLWLGVLTIKLPYESSLASPWEAGALDPSYPFKIIVVNQN